MTEKTKPKVIVDFIEVLIEKRDMQRRPNIKELLNQKFVVYRAEFGVGRSGEFAIVHTDKGEYITFSKVLIDQLRAIDDYLSRHNINGVYVKLVQRKNYLCFVSPAEGDDNE